MKTLEAVHYRFLLRETVISVAICICINALIAYFVFGSSEAIVLWGKGGLAMDLVPTIFLTAFGMTLGMTLSTRKRIENGKAPATAWRRRESNFLRWLPRSVCLRSLVVATVFLLILMPIFLGFLLIAYDFPVDFSATLFFKIFVGAATGLVYTPVILISAMADRGDLPT